LGGGTKASYSSVNSLAAANSQGFIEKVKNTSPSAKCRSINIILMHFPLKKVGALFLKETNKRGTVKEANIRMKEAWKKQRDGSNTSTGFIVQEGALPRWVSSQSQKPTAAYRHEVDIARIMDGKFC
jgi:hypothetical protein